MRVLHRLVIVALGIASVSAGGLPAAAQGGGPSTGGPVLIQVPLPLALPKARTKAGKPGTLRLVTWNLDGSVPAALTRKFIKAKPIWRTTFRARKSAADGPGGPPPKITGDVIALQSVRDLRIVRRLFPARDYHTIVSRQLLTERPGARSSGNPQQPNPKARSPQQGTSAIVIRRGSGLRLLQQEQLLRFAGNRLRDPNLPRRSAAVAVHLRAKGRNFWVLSVDLSWDCAAARTATAGGKTPAAACKSLPEPLRAEQLELLRSWLKDKRKTGEPVLIAGSFNSALGDSKPGSEQWTAAGLSEVSVRKIIAAEAGRQGSSAAAKSRNLPAEKGQASAPSCSQNMQSARDGILLDVAARGREPAEVSGRVVAIAGAKHCPLLLDVRF